MKRGSLLFVAALCLFWCASLAFGAVKYSKVASFKDVGQSRVFFISIDEKVTPDKLEGALWEIVNYHMDTYGQAPQMWIFFFDSKKFTPKDFPIKAENIDHLIARYFYATDNRTKQLTVLGDKEREELKTKGQIESPLWEGQ